MRRVIREAKSRDEPGLRTRPRLMDVRLRGRWMLLIVATLLSQSSAVLASHFVIVKWSDAEPYVRAEAACRARLVAQHHDVRSVLAKDASEKGIPATIGRADAVVAIGTPAARWLHAQLPADAKLIYCMVNNAADAGLLQGRECWGVTTDVLVNDQFKLLHEVLPRAHIVGTLYRGDTLEGKGALQSLKAGLPADWSVEAVAVNEYPSIAAAIAALTRKNVDVIWTAADQKLYDTACVRTLLLACLRAKIPLWGYSPAFVRAGALLGIGVDPANQGDQAADLTLKLASNPASVKEGAQPPREFQIAVNLIVAEQLGLEVPETVSRRAAYVYRTEK